MNAETKTYIITAGSYDDYWIRSILDGPANADIKALFIEYCANYGLDLPISAFTKGKRAGEVRKRADEIGKRLVQDGLLADKESQYLGALLGLNTWSYWELYYDPFKAWLIRDKGFTESTAEEVFLGD